MLIATVGSGVFMALVQVAAQHMPSDPNTGQTEYGLFAALLTTLGQLAIPALGLQSVFAQQVVNATDARRHAELVGTIRGVLKVLLAFWCLVLLLSIVFRNRLLASFEITNPLALWLTLLVALASILTPVFGGLVQGRQDFVWFGWGTICNGLGRFVAVAALVWMLHQKATGAMAGVLAGASATLAIFIWRTRDLWTGESAPFAWADWLRRVLPLTLGLGAMTYVFTQDMISVKLYLPNDAAVYGAGRVVGQALVFLTAPLGQVLFPKVARSHALSEKSNVLIQAIGATGAIGVLAALTCTLFPKLPLIVLRSPFLDAASLIPWFTWCMMPLAMGNVLINYLLARQRFGVVFWLAAVAVAYGITLRYYHATPKQVIGLLGGFSVVLVLVCVVFILRTPHARSPGNENAR